MAEKRRYPPTQTQIHMPATAKAAAKDRKTGGGGGERRKGTQKQTFCVRVLRFKMARWQTKDQSRFMFLTLKHFIVDIAPPTPPLQHRHSSKQSTWKKNGRKKGVHHIILTPAHGCSPVCRPTVIWRDSRFVSNAQQSGRRFFFAQRIWPSSKNHSYILESSLLFSFVFDICVSYLCLVID